MKIYKVALAGYYGFGNLGDELLAEASIEFLLSRGIDRREIVLLSAAPEESERKFGVDSVNRWKISRVCRALRQSETLLLGGGGLFQDATSLRSCVYYWWLVRAARFFEAVPWALGQSVGPLSSYAGRALARNALSFCRAVQVRDAASESLCASLGLSVAVDIGEDFVLSLTDSFAKQNDAPPARLLINLRPHESAGRFADAIAAYAGSFTSSNMEVVGVAMSEEDERLMTRLARDGRLPLTRVERPVSLKDAARVFHNGTAALGMRLHFLILASMADIPLAAAPYDPKVESFASARGIPMWRGGEIPSPRAAVLPDGLPLRVRGDADKLFRKIFP